MDLNAISDADLLGLMAVAPGAEQAQSAWAELYSRHRRYLYVVVSRSYGSYLGEEGVIDLVGDVFLRAYEWAGRQTSAKVIEAFRSESAEVERRKVLGWLGTIAENLFKDRFRHDATRSAQHEDYLNDWRHRESEEEERPCDPQAALLGRALEALDLKDKEVLRLSLPWYDLGSRAFAVPRGEAARLAAMVGLSPEAFRQRRCRALRKLEEVMQQPARRIA